MDSGTFRGEGWADGPLAIRCVACSDGRDCHCSSRCRACAWHADAVDRGAGAVTGASARRAERGGVHRSGGRRQKPASGGSARGSGDVQLPAQEDAASRAAQRERRDARERQQRLYGARAAEVRAAEAALNAAFDRAVRTHNPPMWPSTALR